MKTGMNLLLWTTHVTESDFPTMARLKKMGFDGVEIPVFEGDEAHYQRIRRELQNLGLGATAVTVVTPETNPVSPDAAVRKAALERIKWAISMTAAAGGESLAGPYHSALGAFTGTGPTETEKQHAAEVLTQAADHAAKVGVKLALEYLNRFECYFLTTAADMAAFIKRVNHPSLRTMYDTFHANIEEKSPAAAVGALGDLFVHVHISECDRGTPGTGMVRWQETFKALRKANYDGWLTIEAFGRALPALAAATKVWRDLFPNADGLCEQGLKFMKEQWAAAGK